MLILAVLVVFAWQKYHERRRLALAEAEAAAGSDVAPDPATLAVERPAVTDAGFRCDGRAYCSQMHSCEEATWFLQHCPDMRMDGDNDGIPCEKQWCER